MKRPEVPPIGAARLQSQPESDPPLDATIDARAAAAPEARDVGVGAPAQQAARWVVADRYEILGLLGSGGMGTVYRALDRELDEVIALKMLKKQLAAAPGILDRFRREVKLARKVTHRSVARTFDIGEHAGAKFLTMEFIDGEMLAAMLLRRGRLRVVDVTRLGRDLCAGLSAAHAAGVLHRDLKPANVVVAKDGRAVITDFGIARALDVGSSAQTASGVVVGTPAYMAPEQLEGARDLDARTDVYALGAMLFELLAGEVPWATLSPLQASLARLKGPPPDLRVLRPTLPEKVVALVTRCMARNRDDRFATADDVATALGELDAVRESSPSLLPASVHPSSRRMARTILAVLPIVNEGAPDDEYLAHSLTEDLAEVLASIPDLRVEAALTRESVPASVDAIVMGTVRLSGDRLHVAIRLVMQEDGFALWEGTFERPIAEIVAIADAAAAAMADALSTKKLATPRAMPTNPAAFDLFLRGRHAFLRSWYDEGGRSLKLLSDAHMLAPADASIAAAYARALARSYGTTGGRKEDVARRARETAEKALMLDPRCSDARIALADVSLFRGDAVGAAIELHRSLVLAPDDTDVHAMVGRLRAEVGPLESAAEHLETSLAREPGGSDTRHALARVYALLGDVDASARALGAISTDHAERVGYLLIASRLAMWFRDTGRMAQLAPAIAALDLDLDLDLGRVAFALMRAGDPKPLTAHERELVSRAFPSDSSIGPRVATFHAQLRAEIHLACGDAEVGMIAIRDADANGLVDRMWLDRCPLLAPIRAHPDLEPIRRSTSLRASRVSDVLDGG